VRAARRRVGERRGATGVASHTTHIRSDVTAGLVNAVVSVPDGLASAALAGVNPVYGLYTSIGAPIAATPLLGSELMQVATTSASAIAVAQVISGYPEHQREEAMFLAVLLTGTWLVLFGLLRLGRLVRFVSHAVMTGFLIGVAVVLVLDQLAPLVGYQPEGGNELVQLADLAANVSSFSIQTIGIGLLALGILIGLGRSRFTSFSSIVALVVPTVAVALLGMGDVQLVRDVSPIPRSVPIPSLPDLGLIGFELVLSSFSLGVIIAVQGAGVSQSIPNPDGSRGDASRDMIAQGAGNLLAGLLRGIPAGGSVGQTALNVSAGARSRWASLLSGLWMLAFVLVLPRVVGLVPMTVLAALMILAGISAIDVEEARSIWRTSAAARWSILVTFTATLVLSIPAAVGLGVLLSILFHLESSATDVLVRELVPLDDGRFAEAEPPARLTSEKVTVLDVYGSLFFAGARTLAEALPDPAGAARPAVILRLRGRTEVGATLIDALDEYAEALEEVGGRLYLSGVAPELAVQLRRAGKIDIEQNVRLVPAGNVLGESTSEALAQAREWLGRP